LKHKSKEFQSHINNSFFFSFLFRAENVRRYQQQQLREQTQSAPQQQQQQQQTFKLPETANWARHPSQNNDQNQPLNFAEIQKQEQEQERRAREAALAAQQLVCQYTLNEQLQISEYLNKNNIYHFPRKSSFRICLN